MAAAGAGWGADCGGPRGEAGPAGDEGDGGVAAVTDLDPLQQALADIGKMVAAGSSPEWVTRRIGAIIAGWADELDTGPGLALWRIQRMWDSFTSEAADLQAQLSDAEGADPQAVAQKRRMLATIEAAVATLAAAGGMG